MEALRGSRLFDGEAWLEEPTVLIEDGRIVDAGTPPPDGVDVHELSGYTLLPGFVDPHQHLCFDGLGTLDEQVSDVDDDVLLVRARTAAERALQGGVTTLRDLGDRNYLTLQLRDDASLPTILAAGPPLTREGGHCAFLGGCVGAGDDALRAAVAERVERGVDTVKVMVTGGALSGAFAMWDSQFSTDELRTIVDAAHAAGLPVAAHCHGLDGIEAALAARVDSIEHCTGITPGGRADPSTELLDRLAASGIAISLTLGRRPGYEPPPIVAQNRPTLLAAAHRLVERGGLVCIGTDAGINPAKPHDVLPYGVLDLVEAGASVEAALSAVTSVAATVLRLGDTKGQLRAGYDADVVAVAGDPASEVGCVSDVAAVWSRGERVR